MVRLLSCILASMMAAGWANGQVVRHGDCAVDAEVLVLPKCALETKAGHLYVSQSYLILYFPPTSSTLPPAGSALAGKHELASVHLPGSHGWAYFDRSGRIVVQNVATMDNGPSDFHHGLVRVTYDGKYGLANRHGKLIVPMKYDGMLDYEPKNGWLACTRCHPETDSSGEYHHFKGGSWVWLGPHGDVLRAGKDPSAH